MILKNFARAALTIGAILVVLRQCRKPALNQLAMKLLLPA
jgi:hypothetical protein